MKSPIMMILFQAWFCEKELMVVKMAKTTFLSALSAAAIVSIAAVSVIAAEPADLVFTQTKGGKYIYCNNHERIRSTDLADKSVENSKYLMNNPGLKPDKYAAFIAFMNQTDRDNNNKATGRAGFDVEVDVQFKAVEDTEITIEKLGFEVPEHHNIFLNGSQYAVEDEWGCFGCWATYLELPIKQLNSGNVYEPLGFEAVTFTVNSGETVWLSEYIANYRQVPFGRYVNIMTDFTINSGECDVNVAALRATGTTGDRSGFDPNSAFGSYVRDKNQIGISDGLNEVSANLSYTIDDSDAVGKLPVTVYNYYKPEGNTLTDWYTHLNPKADEWSYELCAESDMLAYDYYDPYKKYLYGSSVKKEDIDEYYHFDVNHIDTAEYKKGYGNASMYVPNREYKAGDSTDLACCLGNYGVKYNYNISITNNGNKRRYLIYKLATSSNNLVYAKDSDGNVINNYVLSKGTSNIRLSNDMTCLPIPAQSTVSYTICVILTPNYSGGMQNSFYIANYPSLIETYETQRGGIEKDRRFDGREYYRWDGGVLSLSNDREEWRDIELPKEVISALAGNYKEYELKWTGNGYMMRPMLYDAGWFENEKPLYRDVYLFDERFNLIRKQTLGSYPQGFTCANGVYYVKLAGSVFRSTTDFKWWDMTQLDMPCWNYGRYSVLTQNGRIKLSENGKDFYDIDYKGFKPEYVDSYGDLYYFAEGRTLYLSKDALNWKHISFNNKVKSFEVFGEKIVANGEEERVLPEFEDTMAIRVNGIFIADELPSILINNSPYVPLRRTMELLGYSVDWNEGRISVLGKEITDIMMIGENAYVPLKVLVEQFGISVSYNGAAAVADISVE